MIKIRPAKRGPGLTMRWQKHDVERMAAIIGDEEAEALHCPVNHAILKLARRRGVHLSRDAQAILRAALYLRTAAAPLYAANDATFGAPDMFPHQRADTFAMDQLKLMGYLLGHRVGAGKTYEAIYHATHQAPQHARLLVITLNSAKEQWVDAIKRWDSRQRSIALVEGSVAEQAKIAATTQSGWIVTHWESIVNARIGYADPFDVVIADEAHKAQNHESQRAKMLHWLAKRARLRLALTAHPFSNDPTELFAILRFLYPWTYTSYWRFFHMHVLASKRHFGGYTIDGARRPKLLQWELQPFFLRRTKGLRIPRVTHERHVGELSPKGRTEYGRMQKQFFVELEKTGDDSKLVIPSELARLTRWRQYLVAPALLGAKEPSIKFQVLADLLDGLDAPPVIFTSFREAVPLAISYLRRGRKRRRFDAITGGMSHRVERVKREFKAGTLDALFVVTQAGSEALNLGGHGQVIFLDLPWNARAIEQAIGRVDRPEEGSGRVVPTTVQRIIVKDSYEESIEKLVIRKHKNFGEVFTVGNLKELFG